MIRRGIHIKHGIRNDNRKNKPISPGSVASGRVYDTKDSFQDELNKNICDVIDKGKGVNRAARPARGLGGSETTIWIDEFKEIEKLMKLSEMSMAEKREEELAPIRASVYKNVKDDMDRIRMIALARMEWNQEQNYGPNVIQMQRRKP